MWQASQRVDRLRAETSKTRRSTARESYTPLMTQFPSFEHGQQDGVELLMSPLPGPLTAALTFRAGTAAASFRTHPVPHLLEHLVLSTLPRGPYELNGTTTVEDLSFHITGTPQQVRDALHGICEAVRRLPLDRLAHEARVIGVETDASGESLVGMHSVLRYGLRGAGLEGLRTVPADQITPEQLTDFARRHLVSGNVVLALTGPVPDGLHLDLPPGPRTSITTELRADVTLPALLRSEAPLTAINIETADEPAAALMARLLRERAEARLRHQLGISYSVDMERIMVTDDRVLRIVAADGRGDDAQQIAGEIISALRALADHGPAAEELAEDARRLEETLRDPRSHRDLLWDQAHRVLNGHPVLPPQELLDQSRAVTAGAVRDAAREALGTALLTVPEEADVDAELLGMVDRTEEEWPLDPEVAGTVHGRRLLSTAPRDLRVVIGEAGLSIRVLGTAASFPWDQVVGVEKSEGWLGIMRADGRSQSIAPRSLRQGDELARAVEERMCHVLYEAADD